MRHTAATIMARNGVSLWVIAQILGNTLEQVEKNYAKWQPGRHLDAVNLITHRRVA
jgi:integrase